MEPELQQTVADRGIQNVYFEGFKQYDELPYYYALADCLVHPARVEVWGLILNEGLAAGNYLISTEDVGAVVDLLDEPTNGLIVETGSSGSLARAIVETASKKAEISSRREQISRRAVEEHSLDVPAEALMVAVKLALGSSDGQ